MMVMTKRGKRWERFLVLLLSLLLAAGNFMAPGMSRIAQAEEMSVVYVHANGNDGNDGTEGSPFATIKTAFEEVADGGTIVLLSDVTLGAQLTLSGGKNVTIQSAENETYAIIRAANYRDKLIQISNTSSKTIVFKNLIMDLCQ